MLAIATYGWPGPLGWLFRNTPGNIVAGFLQLGLGLLIGRFLWAPMSKRFHAAIEQHLRPMHDHNEWMARHLARHLDAHGTPVDPHPQHGDLTAAPLVSRETSQPL